MSVFVFIFELLMAIQDVFLAPLDLELGGGGDVNVNVHRGARAEGERASFPTRSFTYPPRQQIRGFLLFLSLSLSLSLSSF
jgi:hypothetical protein